MGMDPLLIGLLGVLFGAIIVAIFHCVIACYGPEAIRPAGATTTTTTPRLDRRRHNDFHEDEEDEEDNGSSINNYPVLDLIVVSSYNNNECEEEVCAVCLNEFKEGDEVRVLPECCHVFHVLCIDKWLTSRGNCPLCRADTISAAVDAIPVTSTIDQPVPVQT